MIEHIRSVGFKGFDIDEDIPQKVIYTGKNMSGKTTRAGIISLVLYGNIPSSGAGKRPSDILDSFGKDSLVVAVTIKGKEFARKFSRSAKGSVSQTFQFGGKRVSSEVFSIALNNAGAPKIADTTSFMLQSESKKIDTLFELFPNEILNGIDSEIELAKEDVSKWSRKFDESSATVRQITDSKSNIVLPAGSIAETQKNIKDAENQLLDLNQQIKDAEMENMRVEQDLKQKTALSVSRQKALRGINFQIDFEAISKIPEDEWQKFYNDKFLEYQTEQSRILLERKEREREQEQKDKSELPHNTGTVSAMVAEYPRGWKPGLGKEPVTDTTFKTGPAEPEPLHDIGVVTEGSYHITGQTFNNAKTAVLDIPLNADCEEPQYNFGRCKNPYQFEGKFDSRVNCDCKERVGIFDSTGTLLNDSMKTPVTNTVFEVVPENSLDPVESIQKIIDALKGSGCATCAALIIARHELKKYRK